MTNTYSSPRFSLTALIGLVTMFALMICLCTKFYPFGPLWAWFVASAFVFIVGRSLRNTAACVWGGVMVLAGFYAIPFFMMEGHAIAPNRLERVQIGSTADEVRNAIGKPTCVDGNEWLYTNFTWCSCTIYFDANGLVEEIVHDH